MLNIEQLNLNVSKKRRNANRDLSSQGLKKVTLHELIQTFKKRFLKIGWMRTQKSIMKRILVYWRNMLMVQMGLMNPQYYAFWLPLWDESRSLVRDVEASSSLARFNLRRKQYDLIAEQVYSIWTKTNLYSWGTYILLYNLFHNRGAQSYRHTFLLHAPLVLLEFIFLHRQICEQKLVHDSEYHRQDKLLYFGSNFILNCLNTWMMGNVSNAVHLCNLFSWSNNLVELGVWVALYSKFFALHVGQAHAGRVTSRDGSYRLTMDIFQYTLQNMVCSWIEMYMIMNMQKHFSLFPWKKIKKHFADNNFWFIYNILYSMVAPVDLKLTQKFSEYENSFEYERQLHFILKMNQVIGLSFISFLTLTMLVLFILTNLLVRVGLLARANRFIGLVNDGDVWTFLALRLFGTAQALMDAWVFSFIKVFTDSKFFRWSFLIFGTMAPYYLHKFFGGGLIMFSIISLVLESTLVSWYMYRIRRRGNFNTLMFDRMTRRFLPGAVIAGVVYLAFLIKFRHFV